MTPKEILIESKKVLEDPIHWTQSTYAKDKEGNSTWLFDSKATCWCASAIVQKIGQYDFHETKDALNVLYRFQNDERLARFNDTHTHQEVLDLFQQGIDYLS